MIYTNITQLIGKTPLLELTRYEQAHGLSAKLLVKLECFNPGSSAKDRIALAMIQDAEASGRLAPGGTIIEPTSGNTGIGLAMVAAAKGYKVILTMPETMSVERRKLLAGFGAQLVLTPGPQGMQGAVDKAEELHRQIPGSIITGQFDNPANPRAHQTGTGPEIWADTQGKVDVFVAGVGTGGTLTGVGRYLRSQNPQVELVAAQPATSPLLTTGKAGPHGIQGIGPNFLPQVLDTKLYNQVIDVADKDALDTARELRTLEGVNVGISSGCAVWAAAQLAAQPKYAGKVIVALLPDTGDRYLSTALFEEK